MKIFWIDLFSGAGGTTTGIHLSNNEMNVVACVNHDSRAIESHKANHPDCIHFVEDVRDFTVVKRLKVLVERLRKDHPGCFINIWASLECTNYSKAKGGLPRDADSRTLAHALYMYLEKLAPDYLFIENVREFMAWGPLDKNGRPISRLNGSDYIKWINTIINYGYNYEHRLLNAADYGAYTSRERYFGQFAKKGYPISWPEATHTKNPEKSDLFAPLKRWKAVKEVLDLSDEGVSIFLRKKPLAENTLKRIYAGLIKFVAGGEDLFLKKYYSGRPAGKVISTEGPSGTITTFGGSHASVFVQRYNGGDPKEKVKSVDRPLGTILSNNTHASVFIKKYFSGDPKSQVSSIENPSGAITTIDHHAIVTNEFLAAYYGTGKNVSSILQPCPVVPTKDRFQKVKPIFIQNEYSGGGQLSDIDNPNPTLLSQPKQKLTSVNFMDQQFGCSKPKDLKDPNGALTANPKQNLVTAKPWLMDTNFNNMGTIIDEPGKVITASRKHHYLMNPSWGGHSTSVEGPSPVIVARQDKAPMYVLGVESGQYGILVYEDDSEMTVKIKEFMVIYGIIDIKMRMLKIPELLKIQGFPEGYKLKGTKTEQKKFIGNAVVPLMAKAIADCHYNCVFQIQKAS